MSINYLDPQERVLWDETFDPTICDNCGEDLITHDDWPEPLCVKGCVCIWLSDDGDLINENNHPPTCGCPNLCNPDYYHDQGR